VSENGNTVISNNPIVWLLASGNYDKLVDGIGQTLFSDTPQFIAFGEARIVVSGWWCQDVSGIYEHPFPIYNPIEYRCMFEIPPNIEYHPIL
jgi:hypothetical protein